MSAPVDASWIDLEEYASFAIDNHSLFESNTSSTSDARWVKNHNTTSAAASQEYRLRWQELLQCMRISSTGQYAPFLGRESMHSSDKSTCNVTQKMVICLQVVGLNTRPKAPAKSKWTLLCPALDWFFINYCLGVWRVMAAGEYSAWGSFVSGGTAYHAICGVQRVGGAVGFLCRQQSGFQMLVVYRQTS